jgi:hypothetical protein
MINLRYGSEIMSYYETPDGKYHDSEEEAKDHLEKNNPNFSIDIAADDRDGPVYTDPLGNSLTIKRI